MDVVLLHNAKAGRGAWSRKELIKLVREAGFKPRYHELREALADPERMDEGKFVIVAGGDGAIRKTALALLGRPRPIAPLPIGTANNIARSLGLRKKPVKVLAALAEKTKQIDFDVGVAAGPWGHRHFIEGIGLGLISRSMTVIEDIDEIAVHEWKEARHKLHRDVCVAAAIAHDMPGLPVKLTTDGRDRSADFLLLEILNIRRAGPAMELAPKAKTADGQFDIVSVTEQQRSRLLHALKARLADEKHIRSLTTRHAADVELTVGCDCQFRIDDRCERLPANRLVKVSVERKAVQFVVPA